MSNPVTPSAAYSDDDESVYLNETPTDPNEHEPLAPPDAPDAVANKPSVEKPSSASTPAPAGKSLTDQDSNEQVVVVDHHHAAVDRGPSNRDHNSVYDIPTVPWLHQYQTVLTKNVKLICRKPIHLLLFLLSSVASVLLSWLMLARHSSNDKVLPPLTSPCGTIAPEYFDGLEWSEAQATVLSLNEAWRSGLAVTILSLGPMMTAIVAYLMIHEELQLHMLGVLRQLGMRDSVYWCAWYTPLALLAAINSLLAAATAQLLPVHLFESVCFGAIFLSFWGLELALIGASCFLAAVSGTARRGSVWLLLIIMAAVWIPSLILVFSSGSLFLDAQDVSTYQSTITPSGLFWINRHTRLGNDNRNGFSGPINVDDNFQSNDDRFNFSEVFDFDDNFNFERRSCNLPIMSEEEGLFFKTPEEREQLTADDFFVGCYFAAGYGSTAWVPAGKKTSVGAAFLFLIPYFHFANIFGNFAGMTGMPGSDFNLKHTGMSAGELARESLNALSLNRSEDVSFGTTLYPQGSMLQEAYASPDYESFRDCLTIEVDEYYDGEQYRYCSEYKTNCPSENLTGFDFCEESFDSSTCMHAPKSPADGYSVNAMFGMLVALSLIYMVAASYWGIVFVGGAGTLAALFPFLPSYWCSAKRQARSEVDPEIGAGSAIQVESIRKSYGSVDAVTDVSLNMARGEVTALLGHNGAGKTTLSKILTCEIPSSSGDIKVFGHSVRADPYAVRRLVGVCKQDDYLWPNLTAKEHLDVFGGLRGVNRDELDTVVQKWLESVDLDTVQHQQSSEFSGGMKRRLSLALSTIGGRPLIVLDEPTTGMDPVSRRHVWRHIDEIKQNRVVLLTTHAMEEADLLSDMVAVMRGGKLAAWGSPLELKAEHGSALQFTLLVPKQLTEETVAAVRSYFVDAMKWVKIDTSEAGNITVTILKIQQKAGDHGIEVDVLSNFVAWLDDSDVSGVTEYGFSNSSLEEVFLKVTENDVEPPGNVTGTSGNGQQTNSDQEGSVHNTEASDDGVSELAAFSPNLTVRRQTKVLVRHNFIHAWTGRRSLGSWILYGGFVLVSTLLSTWLTNISDKVALLCVPVVFTSFILLNVCGTVYGDRAEGLFYLLRTQGLLKNSYLLGTSVYALLVGLIYCVVFLTLMYATPYWREPRLCTIDYDKNEYCYGGFGQRSLLIPQYGEVRTVRFDSGDSDAQVFAYPAPGGYFRVLAAAVLFAATIPGATLASSYLPGHKFPLVVIAFISLAASLTPLILYLLLNSVIRSPEEVRECGNSIIPLETCEELFTLDTANEDFLNCLGLNLNGFKNVCIPAYASLLPQFGIFQMLSMAYTSNIKFYTEPPEYLNEFISSIEGGHCSGDTCSYPFASKFYRQNALWELLGAVILLVVGVALANVFSFTPAWILREKNRLWHALTPKKTRNHERKSAASTADSTELEEVKAERETIQALMQSILLEEGATDNGVEQSLVDSAKTKQEDFPPIFMHKLRKVYPSFGSAPPKVALDSLDLHVPRGQVLGFLGKNGAGKTTALKILAGAHDATSGLGLVAGYDVHTERINVFESLGNCPQFDVVWPDMTVKEHLLFFSNLKGIPAKDVPFAAENIASAVGLGQTDVYNRNAGSLSGGMRRRLSIAISLVGAPQVFVLDEPTTGLDPSTRNNIWNLINSFSTDNRAIVITTHMMLEADTLCNRIAIISKGKLAVVASQQTLKDKFGSGYLLQLNLIKSTTENQDLAMDFVRARLHSGATLGTKQAKTLHVNIPRDLDLRKAFSALYSPTVRPACINQFLLSQSSLEDVFLALGDS